MDANDVTLPDFKNLQQMKNESLWFRTMISDIQIKFNNAASTFNEKILSHSSNIFNVLITCMLKLEN